ncbi:hypothetical protein K2173_025369 [Erythroxylum novogranatense]|uniref:Uncharacterized protein n=1 Tax=Erythroxylum novogranatense TaxID=1862640 RepID=A0AAV8UHA7_9ROSI|nr:hypothetical protein K2173_025369 [Erythroxylum novogranatense]
MDVQDLDEIHDCVIKPRVNPRRRRNKVYIGCGAGFGGDRPTAALKLLQRVKQLDYLVLECLAERTLVDRYQAMLSGGVGYDIRISEWMHLLLRLAVERGTRIITNMGAMDAVGAQERVLEIASSLGLSVSVAVAHEVLSWKSGSESSPYVMEGGISTYLGATPIVHCLEKYQADVIITSRVADAALFLAPMVYELGWNWNDVKELAQGCLAGHLLECGCQLTGGYFMHPGDKYRDFSFQSLLDLSLPYAEIGFDGEVVVAKAEGSGGMLNFSTCAQQLLYEIGDPCAYITPDLVIDVQDVTFHSLSSCKVLCGRAKPSTRPIPDKLLQLSPKDCGWKGWGEISYGGRNCVKRAEAAEFLVRSWMEEVCPDSSSKVVSYVIGVDSVKATSKTPAGDAVEDIRLRMDGLFELEDQAIQFTREFTALYTNGPAGGGGISTGHKKEIVLEKQLVDRKHVFWRTAIKCTGPGAASKHSCSSFEPPLPSLEKADTPTDLYVECSSQAANTIPAPSGRKIPLYEVAHSRVGDKGNDMNFSIIPHHPPDIQRFELIVTEEWVKEVVSVLLNNSSFANTLDSEAILQRRRWVDENVKVEIYRVKGIHSLNVVVRNILDGGVNCSRRIDRHGKTISDLILCQEVVLPP